jgi:hypothetical protein
VDIENVLYRIVGGYYFITVDDTIYKIYSPKIKLKQKAHRLYLSILDDNKYDTSSWISKNVIDNLLKIYNIWDDKKEKQLEHSLKSLDNAKVELYLNYSNTITRDRLKKLIVSLNKQINDSINKKHHFDYLTLEYYSHSLKNQFLIMNTVYYENDEKVFGDNIYDMDSILLEKILYEIFSVSISLDDIKTLSHHECWRSYWDASKENIFDGSSINWTEEQRSLVNITRMIDSIREHTEPPSEEILKDFDALDGWILHQKDKNEKEKKKQQISDMVSAGKKDRMDEVFIVTNSREQAQEIFDLNDRQTKSNIVNMSKIANKKGSVKWAELPHIKRELDNKFNEMKSNKIKGKK